MTELRKVWHKLINFYDIRKLFLEYSFWENSCLKYKAYTLAEVVLVMLVIAIVVGVSLKITKTKLDNILSVTYYYSYSTLADVNTQIIKRYNSTSEDDIKPDSTYTLTTLPHTGDKYCETFASYVNTKTEDCNGDAIEASNTDFNSKIPDITLRNGVRLFNMSQNPAPISILSGNSRGNKYTKPDDTEVVDIDEWGYTVYIDIDGISNGVNTLWEDVYRFYVTLSGNVIPAYDKDNAGESGGDSVQHLQTSVSKIIVGAKIEWVVKSKSFKESACKMGYVKESTAYCKTNTAVTQDKSNCPDDDSTCSLKIITPIKFF